MGIQDRQLLLSQKSWRNSLSGAGTARVEGSSWRPAVCWPHGLIQEGRRNSRGHTTPGLVSQCEEFGLLPVGAQDPLEEVFGVLLSCDHICTFENILGASRRVKQKGQGGMRSGSLIKAQLANSGGGLLGPSVGRQSESRQETLHLGSLEELSFTTGWRTCRSQEGQRRKPGPAAGEGHQGIKRGAGRGAWKEKTYVCRDTHPEKIYLGSCQPKVILKRNKTLALSPTFLPLHLRLSVD